MKVEIWSDIACPFCYIGKRRFEAAVERSGFGDEVEVVFRSFQLDPTAEIHQTQDVYDMVAAKYGLSRERAVGMHDDIIRQGAEVGVTYRFDDVILTNTLDAHRLIHFAALAGKRTEVAELLFKAFFTDGKHVGEHEALADIAAEAGLDRAETLAMLQGDEYTDAVRADQQEASKLGVRGVPFFVIDRKYAVSGAQPSELFLEALQKARA